MRGPERERVGVRGSGTEGEPRSRGGGVVW
jgi:hypothetical protein